MAVKTKSSPQKIGWGRAISLFFWNTKSELGVFLKIVRLLGIGALAGITIGDDIFNAIPIIDLITIPDAIALALFVLIRIIMIKLRGRV